MWGFWHKFFSKRRKTDSVQPERPAAAAPTLQVEDGGPVEASLRDTVTGLYNQKHLIQRLETNISRCSRSKERMAVILWDIDGFVDFNNRFGQEAGDRFLKKVANTVRGCIRGYDEAFRAGGDEFCALLIPADDNVAKDVTQRVSQAVSKGLFEENSEYAGHQFSISAGLVFYPGESNVAQALLHEAGQALYRSRLQRTP